MRIKRTLTNRRLDVAARTSADQLGQLPPIKAGEVEDESLMIAHVLLSESDDDESVERYAMIDEFGGNGSYALIEADGDGDGSSGAGDHSDGGESDGAGDDGAGGVGSVNFAAQTEFGDGGASPATTKRLQFRPRPSSSVEPAHSTNGDGSGQHEMRRPRSSSLSTAGGGTRGYAGGGPPGKRPMTRPRTSSLSGLDGLATAPSLDPLQGSTGNGQRVRRRCAMAIFAEPSGALSLADFGMLSSLGLVFLRYV
jgi:hypothetical protein